MAGLLLVGGWRRLRLALVPWRTDTARAAPIAAMVRLGAPVGVTQFLEYNAFGAIGLLMGRLGTTGMAGHQAALNLASLTFMVPLGVSAAAAVRVGHAIGRGDAAGARRAALAAYAWGVGFMALSACVLTAVPGALAALYTPDAGVRAVAAALIPIAGVFQLFDGMQVVSLGVLRGAGDTRAPMVINLVGFWLLGIPAGVWLAFRAGAGAEGLWWGLVIGLAAVGVVLALRARHRLTSPVRRVAVD
jgi:MATE family multidrug resistance protein